MTDAARVAMMKAAQREGLAHQIKEKEQAKYMAKVTEADYARQTDLH